MVRSPRIVSLDPRPFQRENYRRLFARSKRLSNAFFAGTVEEALSVANTNYEAADRPRRSKRVSHVFFVSGFSYLMLFDIIEALHGVHPEARILLLSENPNLVCPFLADQHTIHGWCSCGDEHKVIVHCITRLIYADSVVSESMATFLCVCKTNKKVIAREEHKDSLLYKLSPQEWKCFRLLAAGKLEEELPALLGITPRSTTNLFGRLKKKLGAHSRLDVYRIAHEMGLHHQ